MQTRPPLVALLPALAHAAEPLPLPFLVLSPSPAPLLLPARPSRLPLLLLPARPSALPLHRVHALSSARRANSWRETVPTQNMRGKEGGAGADGGWDADEDEDDEEDEDEALSPLLSAVAPLPLLLEAVEPEECALLVPLA